MKKVLVKHGSYGQGKSGNFYMQKQLLLSARLSHSNSVRPFVSWISQKQCELRAVGSPNLHRRCMEDSSFRNCKAFPLI